VTSSTEDHLHQKCQIQDYQKIKTFHYVGYLYYKENLNWAAQNLRLGRMWLAVGHTVATQERIERYFESYKPQIKNRLLGSGQPTKGGREMGFNALR